MARKEKADLRGIGSNEKHLTGKSKWFFISDYRYFAPVVQCRYCLSEYMRCAVDGFCLGCQQRVEFVIREHPETVERTKARGAF